MNATVSPPWHFWIVAVLSLLWNAFGAYDFIMTSIRDPAYLAQVPPEVMQFLDTFPYWAIGVWALGVWGAVLGSLLLLLRSRFAVHAFAASLAGLAVSTVFRQSAGTPAAMQTGAALGMTAVIWIGALALLWYAVRMRKAGVLH